MSIVSIPTDNLYKFLAVFGLVIPVAGIVYPHTVLVDLKERAVKNRASLERVEYEKAELYKDVEILGDAIGINGENFIDTLGQLTESQKALYAERLRNLLLKRHEIDMKVLDIRADTEIAKLYQAEISMLNYVGVGASALGVSMMILGFYAWHHKVQKYQDAILESKASANAGSEGPVLNGRFRRGIKNKNN